MENEDFVSSADEIRTREQAAEAIARLGRHQNELAKKDPHKARFERLEEKVDTLVRASRVMTEREATAGDIPIDGGERELRHFVGDNGIRFRAVDNVVTLPGGQRVKTREPGLLDSGVAQGEWHKRLLLIVSARNLARASMSDKNPNTPHLDVELFRHLERAPGALRTAMSEHFRAFDGSTGQGAEWMQDDFIPELYTAFRVPSGLRNAFGVVEVGSSTILRPRITRGARPYIKGRISGDDYGSYTPSTPQSARTSIQIVGLAVRIVVDDVTMEDSAIVAGAALRAELLSALDDGAEDRLLNGDSAATHMDAIASWDPRGRWGSSGLGQPADHRREVLGFRAAAVDKSLTLDLSGTMSPANFAAIMALLGERGVANLLAITSPEAMVQDFMTMDSVLTLDKIGARASVLQGVGAMVDFMGVPVAMSRFMTSDLNASGVYDGVTTSKTGVIVADRGAWWRYQRRASTVETDKDIKSGAVEMVATAREVIDTPDASDAPNVAYGYNL